MSNSASRAFEGVVRQERDQHQAAVHKVVKLGGIASRPEDATTLGHRGSPLDWFFDGGDQALCRVFLGHLERRNYPGASMVSRPGEVEVAGRGAPVFAGKVTHIKETAIPVVLGYGVGYAFAPERVDEGVLRNPGVVVTAPGPVDGIVPANLCIDQRVRDGQGNVVPPEYTLRTGLADNSPLLYPDSVRQRDPDAQVTLIQMPLMRTLAKIAEAAGRTR
jgi:hypothetical protein